MPILVVVTRVAAEVDLLRPSAFAPANLANDAHDA